MSQNKIKAALIGGGRIGRVHAQTIVGGLPHVDLVAVMDVDTHLLAWVSELSPTTQLTDSLDDILNNPQITHVLICSSTDKHAQHIQELGAASKRIFCEKPIAIDLKTTHKIVNYVEKQDIFLQMGFNRRFDPSIALLKEQIDPKKIAAIHITSCDPQAPPFEYAKRSGGVFKDMSIHDFDMVHFLSGSEIDGVSVTALTHYDKQLKEIPDYDLCSISLRLSNGGLATIFNSRQTPFGYDQRIEVLETQRFFTLGNQNEHQVTVADQKGFLGAKPQYFFLERYKDSYHAELENFFDILTNKPAISARDALRALKVAEACAVSAKEERFVSLSQIE